MGRMLAIYGLVDKRFDGVVLEDPALFDLLAVRMIEDLELAVQVTGRTVDCELVDSDIVGRTLQLLGLDEVAGQMKLPDQMREVTQSIARDYARGPLPYATGALERLGDAVGAATYSFLSTGADNALSEGSQTVKLRHILPACESWPYPLNRFC
jgi:hypothetical protein